MTRYERNDTATPDPLDDGQDVLIIDPSVPAITGRIDLASYAVPSTEGAILARPDRARLIDGKLVVLLNNIAGNFLHMSHGRLVVIDTATDQVVSTVDIPNLSNCGGMSYVEKTRTLVVACNGDFTGDQAATSGLAYIDMAASPPVQTRVQPRPLGGRVLGAYSGIASDGALGFGITPGGFEPTDPRDQLWMLDVASGNATKLDDASGSFNLGGLLVDPVHHHFYLTDGADEAPRVHRWDFTDPAHPVRETLVNANPLPPREVAWY